MGGTDEARFEGANSAAKARAVVTGKPQNQELQPNGAVFALRDWQETKKPEQKKSEKRRFASHEGLHLWTT